MSAFSVPVFCFSGSFLPFWVLLWLWIWLWAWMSASCPLHGCRLPEIWKACPEPCHRANEHTASLHFSPVSAVVLCVEIVEGTEPGNTTEDKGNRLKQPGRYKYLLCLTWPVALCLSNFAVLAPVGQLCVHLRHTRETTHSH